MIFHNYIKIHVLLVGLACTMPLFNYSMNNDNNEKLRSAVLYSNIQQVEENIKAADINRVCIRQRPLEIALEGAGYDLANDLPNKKTSLDIVKLLLRNGANVNLKGLWNWNPLRKAISPNKPQLELIDILLKYGADIDQEIMKQASRKPNSKQIFDLISHHENLRERAQTDPDIPLLKEAINEENIYVIDLILTAKPELKEYLDTIISKSPLKFQDIVYEEEMLPAEIILHIDKFVGHELADLKDLKNKIESFNKFKKLNN